MLDLALRFLHNPFDPANNVALFSAFDRLFPDHGPQPPEDPDAAWRMLCRARRDVERVFGAGWIWPEEQAFKAAWPGLTPRARWLALYHDGLHATLDVEQDAAGEYELAARLLRGERKAFVGSGATDYFAGLHRLYGALALSTLPVGVLRAGAAPLRGAMAGLWGVS